MKKEITIHKRDGLLCLVCIFLFSLQNTTAQILLPKSNLSEKISIHEISEYVDVGQRDLTLEQVTTSKDLKFSPMLNENTDFGFTTHNFWIRFQLKNTAKEKSYYFFETARPITDVAELYVISQDNKITKFISGDAIPREQSSFDHRKTIFKIELNPEEQKQFYLHVKSDGEMLSMPMILYSLEALIQMTSFEQFVFGFFYGILIIAAILYLFFFFGMRDKTFLYYSMYVVFIGLLQFAIDGYFYQFITPQSGWFSLHAVIIFACIANFFLGRYAQVFLKIKETNRTINYAFYVLYFLNAALFLSLFFIPKALQYSYPIANALGLIVLSLIIASQISIYRKTKKIDRFFAIGVFFLVSGFVVFILKNFSVLPLNFWTENGSKLGTGMEVIFLSLSMANLIRNLKNEREELQTLALQKSEEMNELKSYFLSNISHELRTPLNAILNTAKSMAKESNNKEIQDGSQIIKYSTYSLLSSVNDILDFSKIEKNEIKLEPSDFDLVKTVEHIANNFEREASDKGLDFTFQKSEYLPEMVKGDVDRLSQILHNILSNAIKFTNEGFIKFKLDTQKDKANNILVTFTVSDTGVGISKEKINSIYYSFSQEGISNKRKFGGLGLGLYIVKHLVDLHKGKIKIDSTPDLGTVCEIQLNYENIEVVKQPILDNTTALEYDLKGKSILVVEDNAMNQMVIKMITKKWLNTTVEFANNGEEGVKKLTENHYDIILMDLQMPIMDGYEATIAIRNGEAGENKKSIPIIALTADVMETTKSRVIEIGMNKYLSKPVDKDLLFEIIKLLV
ncbi:hybrid sensor histidine kinase/response regulator [Flavobacterium sp. 102]|uniref:hybrid sensor histidine kinase/response regulator n=1 Tax=Flavobacterium sp. 102 TaxID=2135623 RepID=UPI000EB21FEE|nr:hybrid sensor histidine kinase/response regulator [Flavobacterium sp. 102]RKS02437.1 signal transduction histidine kinase [Flavobacterium sp. 102]